MSVALIAVLIIIDFNTPFLVDESLYLTCNLIYEK